jgi:hypothetical protein
MQLSTNLPYGTKAVEAYLANAASPMKANTSHEADRDFMRDLEETDPTRYRNLVKSIYREAPRLAEAA